jgi:hypothetical protein
LKAAPGTQLLAIFRDISSCDYGRNNLEGTRLYSKTASFPIYLVRTYFLMITFLKKKKYRGRV